MTARAAPPIFPLPGHRTMAEVIRDERWESSRAETSQSPPPSKERYDDTRSD